MNEMNHKPSADPGPFAGLRLKDLSQKQNNSWKERWKRYLHNKPSRLIVLSFIGLILTGTFLLTLPIASQSEEWTSPLVALFTATSSTCVTGLILRDTGIYWSYFGQAVILTLIQCGALGMVTIVSAFAYRKNVTITAMRAMKDATAVDSNLQSFSIVRRILLFTFIFESCGIFLIFLAFLRYFPPLEALRKAIFNGISAFCNAGFDTMGPHYGAYSSLTHFQGDPFVLLPIAMLIIGGGLGFIVWFSIGARLRGTPLSFHARLMLRMTLIMLVLGTVVIFMNDCVIDKSKAFAGLSWPEKLLNSFFQSVTFRTAGFNSVDQATLSPSTKVIGVIWMFLGAGPASTAGGIKLTTVAILWASALSDLRLRANDVSLMRHRIARDLVQRASTLFLIALLLVFGACMALSIFESAKNFNFIDLAYEVNSAFGTVGVTSVGTPNLTPASHIVLILLMFLGRVGPVAFGLSLLSPSNKDKDIVYPEGKTVIG